MRELKLTRDDRKFLRQLHIDPQPSDMDVVHDLVTEPGYAPTTVIISHEAARAIIKQYGVLTMETYLAWRTSAN